VATRIKDVTQLEDVTAVLFVVADRMRRGLNPATGEPIQ